MQDRTLKSNKNYHSGFYLEIITGKNSFGQGIKLSSQKQAVQALKKSYTELTKDIGNLGRIEFHDIIFFKFCRVYIKDIHNSG